MGDDRRKPGFPLNGLTDAEIEAIAKASVAELAVQRFFSDDVNPGAVDERLAGMRAARDEGPSGPAAGRRTSGAIMVTARAWAKPQGRADITPSRFERLERDGYFTIDAGWIISALCRAVQIAGPILEPCAGRGHMVRELRAQGFVVRGADLYAYADTLVPDIKTGTDVFDLKSLAGYRFIVTNLPYREQAAILTHLLPIAARDGVNVAVLARSEWSSAAARRALIHQNVRFAGEVRLTTRPEWVRPAIASPRHFSRSLASPAQAKSLRARG